MKKLDISKVDRLFVLFVLRDRFYRDGTSGMLFADGEFICFTLEDAVRSEGVKIPHYTAIQKGIYHVIVNGSTKFGRRMPLIYNVPMFKGIRNHGLNDADDTSGCMGVAYHRHDDKAVIYDSAEKKITELIDNAISKGINPIIVIEEDI